MMRTVFLCATAFFFGVALSRIGFSSWDEVHSMFTFSSWRLIFAFGLAVVLLAISWVIIKKVSSPRWSPRNIHPGTAIGGVLFGAGWALSGACPSIAMVQLGEGQLGALLTLGGVFAGNWLYSVVHEKHFRWATTSCIDD